MLTLKYRFIQWKTWDPLSRKDIGSIGRWYDVDIWTSKTKRNGRITSNNRRKMLSRVWKESARVPSSTRLTILRREMTGDPGWKRNAARPDRFAYPPNTSTQLSRDSSCSWARKKKNPRRENNAPLISLFPFSRILPFEKNTRSCDAILAMILGKKRRDDSIVETTSDFSKTKNSKQPCILGRIHELGEKIANEWTIFRRIYPISSRDSRIRISKRR